MTWRGLAVDEILGVTVDEATEVFDTGKLRTILGGMQRVVLGYLGLGQSATDLCGGEAQRLELVTALQRGSRRPGLVVLDEPITGLHPADIQVMVDAFDPLLEAGNTVVLAEHDLRVAAVADWLDRRPQPRCGGAGRAGARGGPARDGVGRYRPDGRVPAPAAAGRHRVLQLVDSA